MFKKILRILTYNGDGDGDNICGDGVGMGTMSRGWGGDGVVSSSPCQSLICIHCGLPHCKEMLNGFP